MLDKLTAEDYARLEPLFGPSYPNSAFVHAVLHERIPGRAWARVEQGTPVACLVATGSPLCFAAGSLDFEFFEEARALLTGHSPGQGPVQLVHPDEPGLGELAEKAGFSPARRIQFGQPDGEWRPPIVECPTGFELGRIDAETFDSLESPMARSIFGHGADHVAHHVGFCLRKDGRVAADAHGVVGGNLIELGVFTRPEHRRRGLPLAMVAEVSRWGAERGLRTVATCYESKQPSLIIVERLGLVEEFRYPVAELV